MSSLAVRLANIQKRESKMREKERNLETQALQHVIAMGGGILGALARQYVPGLVPGEAGDGLALLASTLILDGLAFYTSSPEVMALSFGYEGKIGGDAFEVAMGWRAPPDKA